MHIFCFHFRFHGNHDFLFLALLAICLVGNDAFWNCHTKEAISEMFAVMQYCNRLG